MNGRVTVLLLLLVGCALSASLNKGSTGFNRKRWLIHGRPWHGLVPPPAAHDASEFPDQWFTQPLDNFNASIKQTYQQRYWSNDQFYKPGGPIFIMLGGEGPESNGWVRAEGLEWVTLAKKFNAMLYLIEHRFYGESQPYGKLIPIDGYQYLSSRQALADMANFIKAKNAEMKYENPKWIVFGGSYSGALAAWARQQYPELVYGSLASSAPIQAEVDFYQYLEVVEFAFSQVDAQCADSIHKQFVLLQKLMKTAAGRETVKVEMQVCERIDPHTPENIYQFWQSMIGNFMGVVQYGGDNAGPYRANQNPQAICEIINRSGPGLSGLVEVNSFFMNVYNESCVDIDYASYLEYMRQPLTNSDRMWTWQTCTEFGYYQSSDSPTAGPWFGDKTRSSMPIDWLVKECGQIFGDMYDSKAVYAAIGKTNAFYGGVAGFKTDRVIFPNGNHDPWSRLGNLHGQNPRSPSIVIDGTAHCGDMYVEADDDLPSLKKARKLIERHMTAWMYH